MTQRDIAWRSLGVALFVAGAAIGVSSRLGESSVPGLAGFLLALFGFVLVVQGKRVPAAFRVERSRHRSLPQSIHARRSRRMDGRRG
ncbi:MULTISPECIES: hypothetical protein [unclassified Sphingomonas]|uniref:hypothetical protein n=1 Tax=unclassified Sphingomonas TaxID=196159 RepID=UPI001F581D2D|nr:MULTISPECIES: hypothetical protein [unclassified Sphingomonas]